MEALDLCLDALGAGGATAVYLRGGEPAWWRVEGSLEPRGEPLPGGPAFEQLVGELLPAGDLAGAEGRTLVFEHGEGRYRLRVEQGAEGWGAIVHRVPDRPPAPAALGLPEALAASIHMRRGLVVVSSRAGGGRTTTLASLLAAIEEVQRRFVVHVDRPVEYRLRGDRAVIHQIEVPTDAADFASGTRRALGAGAGVVALGDLPDEETLRLALEATEAGALVYVAIEARSARDAVAALLDRIPRDGARLLRARLVSALRWIAWQALVPDTRDGRVAAVEMIEGNGALAQAVLHAAHPDDLRAPPRGRPLPGHRTFEAALEQLVVDGRVAPEIAERAREGAG